MPGNQPVFLKHSAVRCLFGPPDAEKLDHWLGSNMNKIKKKNAKKWNFDFDKNRPLPVEENNAIEYERVSQSKVPSLYRSRIVTPKFDPNIPSTSLICREKRESGTAKLQSPKKCCPPTRASKLEVHDIMLPSTLSASGTYTSRSSRSSRSTSIKNFFPIRKRSSSVLFESAPCKRARVESDAKLSTLRSTSSIPRKSPRKIFLRSPRKVMLKPAASFAQETEDEDESKIGDETSSTSYAGARVLRSRIIE